MAKILVVDDDRDMCRMMERDLVRLDHEVAMAHDVLGGRVQARKDAYDVVLLDMRLPDGEGLELLPDLQFGFNVPEVIIITAFADPESAAAAIRSGVWDYLKKPFSVHEMRLTLDRALRYREEKRKQPQVRINRERIVGESVAMKRCLDLVGRAAVSDVNVLITGETGTGKELFARAIHENSARYEQSLVTLDCTVLPEHLLESVLFGHVRGAFTGAETRREGLIMQADGGSLFLDEVGELPLEFQKKFLRVLQEQAFRPVGASREAKSNFRLISATNRNLDAIAEAGRFRKDLLYRLKSFHIELPPLRDRQEDIEELTYHHLSRHCGRFDLAPKGMSDELLQNLKSYLWPGNVRELVNVIDRMLAMARGEPTLYSVHLPPEVRLRMTDRMIEEKEETASTEESDLQRIRMDMSRPLREVREEMVAQVEKAYLSRILDQTKGNVRNACRKSGLARSQFYHLLKKYGIET